jgi:ATP-dependent Clp protease ATP-binding subunit ClpC
MLEKESLNVIVDLEVAKLVKRLADKQIDLVLEESARDLIVTEGYDPDYGARPMRRAVEQLLEDPLAEAILSGSVKEDQHVTAKVKKDAKAVSFKAKARKKQKKAGVSTS